MKPALPRAERRIDDRDRQRVQELADIIAGACPDGRMRHPRVIAAIIIAAGYRRPKPKREQP